MQKNNDLCQKKLKYELQKKSVRLRQRVHDLFFSAGMSKRSISKRLKVSLNFVLSWTKKKKMNFEQDKRGWKKNKGRKWNSFVSRCIIKIHRSLKEGNNFYTGATVIQQEWHKQYKQKPPPLRTIGRVLKQMGLTTPNKKKSSKGASRYLCYPEHSIHHYAGKRVLEIDFIGKKFITGRTEPIHFAAASFKYSPKLRYYRRVDAETADCLMEFLQGVFEQFEIPDVVKMDNGFAMNGSAPQPNVLSKLPLWLLHQKIYPMYAVPRKPFSQASIEGNNSVFGRKFWNRFVFENIKQIEEKLVLFNQASLQYHNYSRPKVSGQNRISKKFIPKIFYLRQVREDERGKAFIEAANTHVTLPKTYINYFVFAEWNLNTELLSVFIEKENQLNEIKTIHFALNPKSKEKLFNEKGQTFTPALPEPVLDRSFICTL